MKHQNKYQIATIGYLVLLALLWGYIQLRGFTEGNVNYTFSFLFGLTPLVAGIIGMYRSRIWGGIRSTLGRAVFFLALGLVCWGLGETIWSYYNIFKHVAAPYPSLADIGFAPSIFFWLIGAGNLAKASGALLRLRRSRKAQVFSLLAVVVLTGLSYLLLIRIARDNVLVPAGESALKIILDIAYPLGDFLAAIFALLVFGLSLKYLGGLYRAAIGAVLAGLGVMYVADFVFSYTTTTGSYYNANWGDLLLCIGLFLISYGTLGLTTKPAIHTGEKEI